MASFDTVNYSLRPSKSIQRQLVFSGIGTLQDHLDLDRLVYVGFGSIWFTDFVMAHKLLDVQDMVSIESDQVGYKRAVYNSPFATVRVLHGLSSAVLPSLYEDPAIKARPWLLWLDYDYELNESVRGDLRSMIENAPENSLLLVTVNGKENRYGKPAERPNYLRSVLGSVVPDELSKDECKDESMQQTLADLGLAYMKSVAAEISRPGGFVPAFRLIYTDSAPMVTIGGILPAKGAVRAAVDTVSDPTWPCRPPEPINAPNLTIREAAALQGLLPSAGSISRQQVQKLGFDLEDRQIEAFERYYRQYPSFAQIVA